MSDSNHIICNIQNEDVTNLNNNIEKLTIKKCIINKIYFPPNLKELKISDSEIKHCEFPLNLISLDIRDSNIANIDGITDKLEFMELENVTIKTINHKHYLPTLVLNFNIKVENIYFDSIGNVQLNGLNYNNQDEDIDLNFLPNNTKELYINNTDLSMDSNIPDKLEKLKIEHDQFEYMTFNSLPISLVEIDSIPLVIYDFKKLINLKIYTTLYGTSDILKNLPDGLETLNLSNDMGSSGIYKFYDVSFPNSLKTIEYPYNNDHECDYPIEIFLNINYNNDLSNFLNNVVSLHLGKNYNQEFNYVLPNSLTELSVSCSYKYFNSIVDSNIQHLIINKSSEDIVNFSVENIIYPKKLKKITSSVYIDFDMLPDSIETIIIENVFGDYHFKLTKQLINLRKIKFINSVGFKFNTERINIPFLHNKNIKLINCINYSVNIIQNYNILESFKLSYNNSKFILPIKLEYDDIPVSFEELLKKNQQVVSLDLGMIYNEKLDYLPKSITELKISYRYKYIDSLHNSNIKHLIIDNFGDYNTYFNINPLINFKNLIKLTSYSNIYFDYLPDSIETIIIFNADNNFILGKKLRNLRKIKFINSNGFSFITDIKYVPKLNNYIKTINCTNYSIKIMNDNNELFNINDSITSEVSTVIDEDNYSNIAEEECNI
jgi:hypothetical protein